jgi:HD-GYP domain-containing protein (c-di-GMP phosphodiesterase class II)
MAATRQLWVRKDSIAESLVAPLRARYELHRISASSHNGHGPASSEAASGVSLWLLDIPSNGNSKSSSSPAAGKRAAKADAVGVFTSKDAAARKKPLASLPRRAPAPVVEAALDAAFEKLELVQRERRAREERNRAESDLEEVLRVGVALSSERNLDTLLTLILQKSCEITMADAGSLYLIEDSEDGSRHLRFKLTQNNSVQFPFKELTMPLAETSMAGYAAVHGEAINLPDAYRVPRSRPYKFNDAFDRESGYRTRSLLTLPMKNARGEVLGVLQLINCKRRRDAVLSAPADFQREVRAFSHHAAKLGLSLASQAAVAYENGKLYEEIQRLFEGFVNASVIAIEQRDPATCGHSFRVSTLTQNLAEIVDRTETGTYAATHFSPEQMKEIRYAALLHDFGKVGVREDVLIKAKKLYPWQLDMLHNRFDFIRKELEAGTSRRKLDLILERGREQAAEVIETVDREFARRMKEIDDDFQFIMQVNEPTVVGSGEFERLFEIARHTYFDPRGNPQPFLLPNEVRLLSIPRGSLDDEERRQIESHVVHTFNFLAQIPWTRELREVPKIARAHHEKLNGRGYPYGLRDSEIPLPAKIMTICDIFDALNAADRPYKAAVPVQRALNILDESVRDNELDRELFNLFVDSKVYERTAK